MGSALQRAKESLSKEIQANERYRAHCGASGQTVPTALAHPFEMRILTVTFEYAVGVLFWSRNEFPIDQFISGSS
jgi:hypothetical protein